MQLKQFSKCDYMSSSRLDQILEEIASHSNPPVHLWTPDHQGDIDIRIDVNANWFHEGEVIARDKLVQLFSTILWSEGNDFFLVTPAEKLKIVVEDVPYVVHQMEKVDESWVATTNTHERLVISEEHPVQLRYFLNEWIPYIRIRYDLWARVNRSIYYQWVEEALSIGSENLVLTSAGYHFAVAKLSDEAAD